MEITDIVTILSAVVGAEGVIQAAKWWLSRQAHKRQDEAAADIAEADADAHEDENHRRQVDWLEQRMKERDEKIDTIYRELREEQQARLAEIHAHHGTQLKLTEAECKKCLKRGCNDRIPPSEY